MYTFGIKIIESMLKQVYKRSLG